MAYAVRSAVCENCGTQFSRRPHRKSDLLKFCSVACSGHVSALIAAEKRTLDPARRKSRNPTVECPDCGSQMSLRSKSCQACRERVARAAVEGTTLGALRARYSLNQYHAKLRGYSRAAYAGPMECLVCSYSLHVDVCHLRDVKDFPMSATVGEVNDPSNLVALCRNHHWEFDNGHLTVGGLLKARGTKDGASA